MMSLICRGIGRWTSTITRPRPFVVGRDQTIVSTARLGTRCSGCVMKAASLAAVLSWHLTLTAISTATGPTAMEQLPPTDTQSPSQSSSKKYIIS